MVRKVEITSGKLRKAIKMSFKGWRYTAFIGGFVGFIGLTLYPIAISPMMDSSEYKKIQLETRRGIRQEDIQPGNMKVWSDPFDRKKQEKE